MIALTQEKREELIDHNSQKLKSLKYNIKEATIPLLRKHLEIEIQSTEIALASLTADIFGYGIAEPDSTIYLSECCIDKYGSTVIDEVTTLNNGVTELDGGYKVVQLFTAPPVPEIKLSLLQSRDLEALIRFNETCEDGEGYDLSKDKMDRLVELGVVRKIKGCIREITALGQMYIDINCQDSPPEFLMTETDRAAAFNQHIKRLNGLGE